MASSADDDLFDQIDDLLDFPDESGNNYETDFLCGDFPSIWTQSDAFTGLEPDLTMNHSHSNSDHSAELSVPYEEIAQLEWLSTFVEDSFSAGNSLTVDVPNTTTVSRFHMSSPVSVLESSTSNYAGAKFLPAKPLAPHPTGRCGRPRSDRPRPPTSMQSFTKGSLPCEGQSFGELGSSSLKIRKSVSSTEKKKRKKKKKKIKLYVPAEVDQNDTPNPLSPLLAVRKCQHCEITKTPQWRAGPMGPKTLCNACGVRFKSGRLFPEYRPAASPTFVPSMHSNSHKKVLEMRVKTCNWTGSPLIEDCLCNTQIELIPNKNPVVDYI